MIDFNDCPICKSHSSVPVPPDAPEGPDGRIENRLKSSFCMACGSRITFDVSAGRKVREPNVEWMDKCPGCNGQLTFNEGSFMSSPRPISPFQQGTPKPTMRLGWCEACQKKHLVMTKEMHQRVELLKAQRAAN